MAIAKGAGDRPTELKNQQQPGKVAKFTRYFEMRDSNDRVVYYHFFASNNSRGHLKMKHCVWRVDPLGGFTFSDSTNPNQRVLFFNPSVAPLIKDLQSKFHGAIQVRIQQIETFNKDRTPYLRKHMGEALTRLESAGSQSCRVQSDGKRRRSGTYPNDALLSFE